MKKKPLITWAVVLLLAIALNPSSSHAESSIKHKETIRRSCKEVELARSYMAKKDYAQAEIMFKKALQINPQNDEAYVGLGEIYIAQGNYAQAEIMFKKALEINPENDKAYTELGKLYIIRGDHAKLDIFTC